MEEALHARADNVRAGLQPGVWGNRRTEWEHRLDRKMRLRTVGALVPQRAAPLRLCHSTRVHAQLGCEDELRWVAIIWTNFFPCHLTKRRVASNKMTQRWKRSFGWSMKILNHLELRRFRLDWQNKFVRKLFFTFRGNNFSLLLTPRRIVDFTFRSFCMRVYDFFLNLRRIENSDAFVNKNSRVFGKHTCRIRFEDLSTALKGSFF